MMNCWSYDPTERPTASGLHEEIDQLLHEMEMGAENNLYIINNQLTTVTGNGNGDGQRYQTDNLEEDLPILSRNPTIPPKKIPRVSFNIKFRHFTRIYSSLKL